VIKILKIARTRTFFTDAGTGSRGINHEKAQIPKSKNPGEKSRCYSVPRRPLIRTH